MTNQTVATLDEVIAANIAALIEYSKLTRPQVGRRLVALGLKGWNERSAWARLASGERRLRAVELFAFSQVFRVSVEDLAIPGLVSTLDYPYGPEDRPDDVPPVPQVSVKPFATMPELPYEEYLTDFLWIPTGVLPGTQNPYRGVRFGSDDSFPYWATPAERVHAIEAAIELIDRLSKESGLDDGMAEAVKATAKLMIQDDDVPDLNAAPTLLDVLEKLASSSQREDGE